LAFPAGAETTAGNGPSTVKLDQLPVELRGQLLARQAAEPGRVPPGLHPSEDGATFLYGGPASCEGSPSEARTPEAPAPYTAALARNLAGGIEVTAAGSAWPVRLFPLSLTGKSGEIAGENVEYRGARGTKVVYSFKANGVKEEIVVDRPVADEMSLDFRLEIDPMLSARLDGKGNLLIYGPDSVLGGFVQAGDEKSAELLLKARQKALKDRLLYVVPAPVVLDAGGRRQPGLARFTLAEGTLTLHATGLAGLAAPVTIDPSIVVTTTADFTTGNNEGMITFDTDAISRGSASGGGVGPVWFCTSLPTARADHAAVAFNGFLYVTGGWNGTSALDEVLFAPINADGSLGAWTAAASLPAARRWHSCVVYDGRLYVIGGQGVVNWDTVYRAAINADGSLSAWTLEGRLPANRYGHTSVAYDGYLYILGGTNGTTATSDVLVAAINGDGSLGSFTITTSFATARYHHASVAYGGNVYVIGGHSDVTSTLNDVQYAPIHADGSLGIWISTTPLGILGREKMGATVSRGYLYLSGGVTLGGTELFSIQAAPVYQNGSLGPWTMVIDGYAPGSGLASVATGARLYLLGGGDGGAVHDVVFSAIFAADLRLPDWVHATSLPEPREFHASVVANGQVYVIGGVILSGFSQTVGSAPLSPDGGIGTWKSERPLPGKRAFATSVVHNGFLYVIGGWDNGVSCAFSCSDVFVAPIGADGTLGTFTTTTSLPAGRKYHASTLYNGRLYVLGGDVSIIGQQNDVLVAPFNADGTLGSWSTTTPFAGPRTNHASVVYNGFLYVLGGHGSAGSYFNDVQFARIQADGSIGAWNSTTSFSHPRTAHTAVADNGNLFVIGGAESGGYWDSVQVAPINADGTIGSWAAGSPLTSSRSAHSSAIYNGYVYVLGGEDALTGLLDDVRYTRANTHGTLPGPSWTATTSFPTPRSGLAAVASGNRLYVLGGHGTSNLADVQSAAIGDNGSVGAWGATTSFSTARTDHAAVAYRDHLYVLGGFSNTYLGDVQVATVASDGSVGSWATTAGLGVPRDSLAAVAWRDHLYVLGGRTGASSYLDEVLVAPINADGTLGAWAATTPFATPRYGHAAAVHNGILYVLGGYGGGSNRLDDVQYAPINADGSVGAWTRAASFDVGRDGATAFADNGYLYVIAGNAGNFLDNIQFTPINSTGSLGFWAETLPAPTARSNHASVAVGGYLYLLGGESETGLLNDVQVATIAGPAARGRYSKVVDFGENRIVDSIGFHSSPTKGVLNLTYAFGESAFGARTTIPEAESDAVYTTGLGGCARYVRASFDLDDRSSATIDDHGLNGRKDLLDFNVSSTSINPTNVTASATATNQITVSWDAVAGAESYDVYRRKSACTSASYTHLASGVTGTTYVDNTVSGGSTYSYKILTLMPSGCLSAYSGCAEALATGDCYIAPTFGGVRSAVYDGASPTCRIHLSWSAGVSRCTSGPGLSYHVYRSTDPAFTPSAANRIAQCVAATTFDDADVTWGTAYHYLVRAEDTTAVGGGPCNGGNVDANTTKTNATTGVNVLFADGFENGMENWAVAGSWTDTTTQAHTGTHSADSGSVASTCGRLMHAAIAIPAGASNPKLRFWTKYSLKTVNGEAGIVQGSPNGTTTWTKLTVSPAYPGTSDASTNSCLGTNPQPAFTGVSSTWTEYSVDLSSYAGGNFYFRFNVVTTGTLGLQGHWYIDDVSVTYEISCSTAAHPGQVPGALSLTGFQDDVLLDWTAPGGSCTATGYGVYRGSLPMTGYDHASLDCSVGGTSYADVNPPGDYYYVVVPLNSSREGLYGASSNGIQIPQGTGACRTQDLTSCN
jgi:N-acetylneuraminic acid mutarotase